MSTQIARMQSNHDSHIWPTSLANHAHPKHALMRLVDRLRMRSVQGRQLGTLSLKLLQETNFVSPKRLIVCEHVIVSAGLLHSAILRRSLQDIIHLRIPNAHTRGNHHGTESLHTKAVPHNRSTVAASRPPFCGPPSGSGWTSTDGPAET